MEFSLIYIKFNGGGERKGDLMNLCKENEMSQLFTVSGYASLLMQRKRRIYGKAITMFVEM